MKQEYTQMLVTIDGEEVACVWNIKEYAWDIHFRGAHITIYMSMCVHEHTSEEVERLVVEQIANDEWNFLNSVGYANRNGEAKKCQT